MRGASGAMKQSQHRATKKFGRVAAGKVDAASFFGASRRPQVVRAAETTTTSRFNKKASLNSLMVVSNRPSALVQRKAKAQTNFERAVSKRLSGWASATYSAAAKVTARGANFMSTTNVRSGGALTRGHPTGSPPPAASSGGSSTGVSSTGSASSSGKPVGGGVDCSATESCGGALGSELSSSDSDSAVPSHRSRHDHDR